MIVRDENGKLFMKNLEISILCDDLLDICENRKEVERVVNNMVENLLLSAQDKLKNLGDENPYDIDINL